MPLRSSWGNPRQKKSLCFYVFIARVLKGPAIRTQLAEFDSYNICGRTKFLNRSVGKLGGNAAGLFFAFSAHSRYLDKSLFSRTSFPLRGHDPNMGGPPGEN